MMGEKVTLHLKNENLQVRIEPQELLNIFVELIDMEVVKKEKDRIEVLAVPIGSAVMVFRRGESHSTVKATESAN